MELSFALVNSSNMVAMMRELLQFLERSEAEFKTACSSAIVLAAERHAPTDKCHLDTLFQVFLKVTRQLFCTYVFQIVLSGNYSL